MNYFVGKVKIKIEDLKQLWKASDNGRVVQVNNPFLTNFDQFDKIRCISLQDVRTKLQKRGMFSHVSGTRGLGPGEGWGLERAGAWRGLGPRGLGPGEGWG